MKLLRYVWLVFLIKFEVLIYEFKWLFEKWFKAKKNALIAYKAVVNAVCSFDLGFTDLMFVCVS